MKENGPGRKGIRDGSNFSARTELIVKADKEPPPGLGRDDGKGLKTFDQGDIEVGGSGRKAFHAFVSSLKYIIVATLILGLLYPLAVWVPSQVLFEHKANGSPIIFNGTTIGSELIGQEFESPGYFWSRPSATGEFPYNALWSSGSNLGPSNENLTKDINERLDELQNSTSDNVSLVPVDLVTASGSGLDPHISYASAIYQVPRVALARNTTNASVLEIVNLNTERTPQGDKMVNVLMTNIGLDRSKLPSRPSGPDAPIKAQEVEDGQISGFSGRDLGFVLVFIMALVVMTIPFIVAFNRTYSDQKRSEGSEGTSESHFEEDDEKKKLSRSLRPLLGLPEQIIKFLGIDGRRDMDWKEYAVCIGFFNLIGFIVLFLLLLFQNALPYNPFDAPGMSIPGAFNSAISFVSNTNWQWYRGETQVSPLVQMLGLTVQNFLSAASGIVVLIALARAIARKNMRTIGNFWSDVTRAIVILLISSFILSIFLVSQGCPQTLSTSIDGQMLDPSAYNGNTTVQQIPLGPIASQEAIKIIGTNGGGYFNANSAHPFENPTPLSNIMEIAMILTIPISLCFLYGRIVKDRRQGIALLVTMVLLFVPFFMATTAYESRGNEAIEEALPLDGSRSGDRPGGNMEGKEVRFGIVPTSLFAISTTSVSCGAVNSMHDSFMPISGMFPLFMMLTGEVVFGGVGSGLYGMLVFVLIAIFIAGLMIGKMPEYMGKKIGSLEMRLCIAIILAPLALILIGSTLALSTDAGRAGILNPGPHGLTEVFYAYTSCSQNNGSAFAGLDASSDFYCWTLGLCMLIGRFLVMGLTLALAGTLVEKKITPPGSGTLPTYNSLFIIWLALVVILLGALSYLAVLLIGPIVEHLFL